MQNLTTRATFQEARDVSIKQAETKFGACSEEAIAVIRAWAAVGLFDTNGDKPILIDTIEIIPGKCLDTLAEISVMVKGGNQGLDFDWDNGMTGATISKLEAGQYIVTVSKSSNCLMTIVDTVEVEEADAFKLKMESKAPTTCKAADGSLFIDVKNFTGPLKYEWYKNGDLIGSSPRITGLSEGFYFVKVEDSGKGCLDFLEADLKSKGLQVSIQGGGTQPK